MEKKDINFIDLIYTIIRWRKFIIINFLIVSVVAVIISLFLSKWYQAETIIMPPEKEGLPFGYGTAGEVAGMLLGGGGGFELPMFATASDIYDTILKSKSVMVNIIDKYDLKTVYKSRTLEDAILALTSHTQIEIGKEGSIFIRFEAEEDPTLAANVANQYVEELDKVNKRIKISKASLTREFVEQRLNETKTNLKNAEENLKLYKEKFNAISLPDQTKAAINSAAELLAQQMALKVQFGVMQKTMSESHFEMMQLKSKIAEIDKLIMKLKYGESPNQETPMTINDELFFPLANTPQLGLDLARLIRELKIQEILFELLTQQYEQARINEARDTSTIQVLDKAIPPSRKHRPKRAIIVIIAAMTSVFFSLFLIFTIEYLRHLKEHYPSEYAKIEIIRNAFIKDMRVFRKR